MFGGISEWLHGIGKYLVSLFVFSHLADSYRLNLQSSASTSMCDVSVWTFGSVCGWLHDVGTSVVSAFVFLCYFVTDMLDLEHYRIDLDPATVMHQTHLVQ